MTTIMAMTMTMIVTMMILKRMLSRILGARTVRWDQDTNGYRHLPQRHAICYAPSSHTSSSSSSSSLLSPKCENPCVALYAWQYVGPLSRAKFVIEFDLNMAKNGLKGERNAKWKSGLPDWNYALVFKSLGPYPRRQMNEDISPFLVVGRRERTPDPEDFVLMNKNSHNNNAYYNISVKMINQMDEWT